MRHAKSGKKFNRTSEEKRALFANLAGALVRHEQIKTTLPKAKALRPIVEKLVTKARKNTLASRREIHAFLYEKGLARKLCDVLAPRYASRPGGYLRIIKMGFRHGDAAPIALIEFVDRNKEARGQEPEGNQKKSASKGAPPAATKGSTAGKISSTPKESALKVTKAPKERVMKQQAKG